MGSVEDIEVFCVLNYIQKDSGFPAYVLFSPTVIDMDRNGGEMEIVVGTSAGNVHVIQIDNSVVRDRQGFPYSMGVIHGQVSQYKSFKTFQFGNMSLHLQPI